jgi:YD repeat-containing protein
MKIKKLLFLTVILIAAVVSFFACQSKKTATVTDNVKYYRQLAMTETPWDTERGIHPLTADEAKTINNYKFTYDENKRLVSVEFNRNGVLLDYSSMGAARVTYEYNGNMQVKHFFNQKNEPIDNNGVFTFNYELDNAAMRVGLTFLDKEGKPVENRNKINKWVWLKLPDGMIRELRYNLAGDSVVMNPFCPFYELRFSYNDKGFVTRLANFDNDTLYNCTAENCGDIGVSYFLFDNNEAGDVLSFTVHHTSGRLSNLYWGWAKRVNKVDANGYVVETAMYDQDDEYLGGKNVPVTQSVYDEHGAMVKRINMDRDRNIINQPDNGVAITEYTYDEQGHRTGTLRFNKEHVKIEDKS